MLQTARCSAGKNSPGIPFAARARRRVSVDDCGSESVAANTESGVGTRRRSCGLGSQPEIAVPGFVLGGIAAGFGKFNE